MLERLTARVLLLDPLDRLLLIRGHPPHDPAAPCVWWTVGGGAEPGESLLETAAREIVEETGFTDARLGPVVWRSEAVIRGVDGQPMHFKERFVVARTAGGPLSRQGWQPIEHQLLEELRWWTLDELHLTAETIFPEGLAELLPDVLAGRIAREPLVIRTLDGPVVPIPRPR